MSKHSENKKALEDALGLKFQKGRDADWGSTDIMSIKGNQFTGMFICDLKPLTGEDRLVVMVRLQDSMTGEYEDTDIIDFDSNVDDVHYLVGKLNWI